jgi:RES domain-containing protein
VNVQGVWYRSVDGDVFRHFYNARKPARPLWALGAPKSGARFTPKDGAPSLYVAEDVVTATHEGLQVTLGTPVKPPAGVTRAVYTVKVQLGNIIDLRDKSVSALLGTNAAELKGAWRYRRDKKVPATQRLGRLAAKLGVEGLLFQSTKGSGACLVVFPANLKGPSFLEVSDATNVLERLP